jgi:F-type H+-transporting ATPase subunit gamma
VNIKKTLLVPITTDKGLCGGLNTNVVKEIKLMVKENRNSFKIFVKKLKGVLLGEGKP